ncbi:uncharacterized protein [Branchiostoma lanceolatum]|uniref:uncharacterized protein n=1 Tax=Branchiostoma lanceolatum TaxID=7740 RepID=UPI0034522D50
MGGAKAFSTDQVVQEKSSFKASLLRWAVRVILVLIILGFYNHHSHVEEENSALSERVQQLEKEMRELHEHCVVKTSSDYAGVQKGSGATDEPRKHEEEEIKTADKKASMMTDSAAKETVGKEGKLVDEHDAEGRIERSKLAGVKDL